MQTSTSLHFLCRLDQVFIVLYCRSLFSFSILVQVYSSFVDQHKLTLQNSTGLLFLSLCILAQIYSLSLSLYTSPHLLFLLYQYNFTRPDQSAQVYLLLYTSITLLDQSALSLCILPLYSLCRSAQVYFFVIVDYYKFTHSLFENKLNFLNVCYLPPSQNIKK